ncbi:MAG: hypothetical protein IJP11_06800 [Oscillospiraceae bacterium]|nr:hypothetical protein [Oscillospiraceae bacterium]
MRKWLKIGDIPNEVYGITVPTAELLYRAWNRSRKYSALLNAATQNVEDCLKSDTGRLMLANSEFLMLFSQTSTGQQELSKLLHISDDETDLITGTAPGHGLLRILRDGAVLQHHPAGYGTL